MLTKRQQEVYGAFREYSLNHQYPPTHRELSEIIGTHSHSYIKRALLAIEKEGLVRKISPDRDLSRAYVLVGFKYVKSRPIQAELSDDESRLYSAIVDYTMDFYQTPRIQYLCRTLDWSVFKVKDRLERLESKGVIEVHEKKHRAFTLSEYEARLD